MVKLVQDLIRAAINFDPNLSREQWVYVFMGLVVFGFYMMRGFGARGRI
jgi:hypothetical protein